MLGVQKLDFVYYILYVVLGKVIIYKSRGEVSIGATHNWMCVFSLLKIYI